MNKEYYYLVSSLVELTKDFDKKSISTKELLEFCSEQLSHADFNNLKKIYLFNDIKNTINFYEKKDQYEYLYPAFYSQEEFIELLKDTDSFLPFLSEFHFNKRSENRLFPEILEIDELILLFYLNLDEIKDQFIKKFFLFELDLRNITTALEMKKNNLPFNNKLIPFNDEYKILLKSTSPDFGLSEHLPYMNRLIESYKNDDLIKIEKTIESIRWDWLDEETAQENFSIEFIYAYAIKLKSIERWTNMTDEKGREVLNNLIKRIKESIKL